MSGLGPSRGVCPSGAGAARRSVRGGAADARAALVELSACATVEARGPEARAFLRRLLACDVDRLAPGSARRAVMMAPLGGLMDLPVVARQSGGAYRLVFGPEGGPRCATWMRQVARAFEVEVDAKEGESPIAVLGEAAGECVAGCGLSAEALALAPDAFGAPGRLLFLSEDAARTAWDALARRGAAPADEAARESMRIGAGIPMFGVDVDEDTSPVEAGLLAGVDLADASREFFGRAMTVALRERGVNWTLCGLRLLDEGRLAAGDPVRSSRGTGIVTSAAEVAGGEWLAFAKLPAGVAPGEMVMVGAGRRLACMTVRMPAG